MITIPLEELMDLIQTAIRNELHFLKPPSSKKDTEFITRRDTAELLNVSLPTLDKWSKDGLLTAHRISKTNSIRYNKSEVLSSITAIRTIKSMKGGVDASS